MRRNTARRWASSTAAASSPRGARRRSRASSTRASLTSPPGRPICGRCNRRSTAAGRVWASSFRPTSPHHCRPGGRRRGRASWMPRIPRWPAVRSPPRGRVGGGRRPPGSGPPNDELPLEIRPRAWYNPDLRSVNFMVPGLLAVVLQMLTMMLTAVAIVRERELGTLEQLVATPIRKTELMLGKILPYVTLGYVDITLALLIAAYWFRVPIRGSLVLLYALALIFYLATLGQGILISTVSRTQRQAMQGSFFLFLPTILLSGFMFPREGMPLVIQWIGYALPLTYFLVIVRGIILKGIGFMELSNQIVPLAILGLIFFTVSVLRFQKRLE